MTSDRLVRAASRAVAVAATAAAGAVAIEWCLSRAASSGQPLLDRVRSRVNVAAAREIAWDVLADVEGQVRWMHDAKAIRILTPGPIGVGTRAEADVRIFGLRSTDVVEIVVWEPPGRFTIRHLGLFKGDGDFRLEKVAGATVVTWDERLVPPFLPHLGAAVLWPVLRLVFQADLERFAALVREQAAASAPRD